MSQEEIAAAVAELTRARRAFGEVYLIRLGAGVWRLATIRAFPVLRRRGHAERALTRLCVLADQHRIELRLDVEPLAGEDDVDPARLAVWYEKHAFRRLPARRGPVRMARRPQE